MKIQKLYPNPHLFFYLKNDEFIVVDVYRKNEYALELEYFDRIKFWNGTNEAVLTPQDYELLNENLILNQPINDRGWQGDKISYLSFIAAHNSQDATPKRSDEECQEFLLAYAADRQALPETTSPSLIIARYDLPEPRFERLYNIPYAQPLKNRTTSRSFNALNITAQDFSDLLFVGFGYIHGQDWPSFDNSSFKNLWKRKASPSATGLHATEGYVVVSHVEGIPAGFYKYDPENHQLWQLQTSFTDKDLSFAVADQFWIKGSACTFFLVHDLARGWFKENTMRTITNAYLEAGHISQTLLLTATALGLNTWLSAVMREYFLKEILHIDENRYLLASIVSAGYGTNDPIPALLKGKYLDDNIPL